MKTCLERLFFLEGAPSIVQSDNGKEFKNSLLSELYKKWNIISVFGRPRHPQSQGQIERANQTLVRSLSKALHKKPKTWLTILGKKL